MEINDGTPLGPGFLVFFQQEPEEPFVGSGIEEITRRKRLKKKGDEDIIMMAIRSFLSKEG